MCLAIPGKVIEINQKQALVEYPHEKRNVFLVGTPVREGDYVMVQMGIIVKVISKEEAKISLNAWIKNS